MILSPMTLGEFAYGQKREVIDPMLACWIEKQFQVQWGTGHWM